MPADLDRTVRVIESSEPKLRGEIGDFSNYLSVSNIILLGDPGAGKTHTFKTAAEEEKVEHFTVREFLACAGDEEVKIVYLDGLDEFRSRSDDNHLVLHLIDRLNRQGHPQIRISCRGADWLGESDLVLFKRFFGRSSYVVLNLEPFSEEEIYTLLETKEVSEPEEFIIKAKSLNLESLLGNPQTLIMLVDVVLRDAWPDTRKELFEKSCKILLEEFNRDHTRSSQGRFSAEELVEPAGEIAATLLLAGVSGVSLLDIMVNTRAE